MDEMQYCEVLGIRTRYFRTGSGSPLLILHGWGCRIETIRAVISELAKEFAVTACDLPGHGESALPPEPWGDDEYSNWVVHFLDAMQISRTAILGHSVGGRFGLLVAAKHPERVERLVAAAASGIKPPRPLKFYFKVALAKTGKLLARFGGRFGERVKEAIYRQIASPDYLQAGPLRPTFTKIVSKDIRGVLGQISCPTLLVWGVQDAETPLSSGELMHRLIPRSELAIIDHAGHYSFIDQPLAFQLHIRRFLSGKSQP